MTDLLTLAEVQRASLKEAFEARHANLLPVLAASQVTYEVILKKSSGQPVPAIFFTMKGGTPTFIKEVRLTENGVALGGKVSLSAEELTAVLAEWVLRKTKQASNLEKEEQATFKSLDTLGNCIMQLGALLSSLCLVGGWLLAGRVDAELGPLFLWWLPVCLIILGAGGMIRLINWLLGPKGLASSN